MPPPPIYQNTGTTNTARSADADADNVCAQRGRRRSALKPPSRLRQLTLFQRQKSDHSVKVAHLTSVHSPFDVRIFHKQCKSLARSGYEVTLTALQARDERKDRVQIKAVPAATRRLQRMTLGVWRVYREALRQNADLYHFHDPELIPVGLLLAGRGKPVIYDIHENLPADIHEKYYIPVWFRPLLSRVIEWLEKASVRNFAALVSATSTIQERFRRFNPNTVLVRNFSLPQEMNVPTELTWNQRPLSVAYIGGINPWRGIRQVVEAMSLLTPELQATLKLAGPYSPQTFRDELAGLPGWSRVDEVGVLDRAALVALLSQARAGLAGF